MLIKIPLIQYLFEIRSMRQTIKEIEVNVAYRWFLGLEMSDPVPHFSTFGKNYTRRFKDTNLFEQIFAKILEECYRWDFVDDSVAFVDATHIKACANRRKAIKKTAKQEALFYEGMLQKEIEQDRTVESLRLNNGVLSNESAILLSSCSFIALCIFSSKASCNFPLTF